MSAVEKLITDNLDVWSSAIKAKSATGRGTSKKLELYGIKKLRELILELAARGLLVPQDAGDEPASELLKKITVEKERLLKEGKIKKQKALPEVTEDEKYCVLPIGWEWSRLGEVTNYGTTDKAEPGDVDEETWVLELEDVEKETSRLLQKIRYSEKKFQSSKNRFIKNDVIYGKLRPYLDKVIVADEDGVCTTEMIPVRGYFRIFPTYLRLVMKSPHFIMYADDSTHGMNLPRLGTDKARMALFPIAPYDEQHRIVAKVDELMALCDQLEQQTETSISAHQTLVQTVLETLTNTSEREGFNQAWTRIAEHFDTLFTTEWSIDQLKQTILQLAVMGKLVPQVPNDEPASELLKIIADEKARLVKEGKIKKQKPLPPIGEGEKPFDLPVGWEWCRLHDSIDVRDGTHDSPKDAGGVNTFPLVTSKNFTDGMIDFESARRISEQDHIEISKRSLVEVDDILFSMIGGNIGNQVIVRDSRPFSIKNVALFKYYDKSATEPKFFKIYTEELAIELQKEASGGAQPFVSLGALRKLVFALPPIEEQHRIVTKVDELMTLCDTLKSHLNSAQTTQFKLADTLAEQAIG